MKKPNDPLSDADKTAVQKAANRLQQNNALQLSSEIAQDLAMTNLATREMLKLAQDVQAYTGDPQISDIINKIQNMLRKC